MGIVREMLKNDPDLNLYLLAFENPELEDEALEIAREQSDTGIISELAHGRAANRIRRLNKIIAGDQS